ncbi:hypothetical protein DICA1_C14268 [Diutina catenulata]
MLHPIILPLVIWTFLIAQASALTITEDTVTTGEFSEDVGDIEISPGVFWSHFNSSYARFQDVKVGSGGGLYLTTNESSIGLTVSTSGFLNEGTVAFNNEQSQMSATYMFGGPYFRNEGQMFLSSAGEDGYFMVNIASEEWQNDGLLSFSQTRKGQSSMYLYGQSIVNNGDICFYNTFYQQSSPLSGNGCMHIIEDALVHFPTSDSLTVAESHSIQFDPGSTGAFYVDMTPQSGDYIVRGFGRGMYVGSSYELKSFSYEGSILTINLANYNSTKRIDIGKGYDPDLFSLTSYQPPANDVWSYPNNAIVYEGDVPDEAASASNCGVCTRMVEAPSEVPQVPSSSESSEISSTSSPSAVITSSHDLSSEFLSSTEDLTSISEIPTSRSSENTETPSSSESVSLSNSSESGLTESASELGSTETSSALDETSSASTDLESESEDYYSTASLTSESQSLVDEESTTGQDSSKEVSSVTISPSSSIEESTSALTMSVEESSWVSESTEDQNWHTETSSTTDSSSSNTSESTMTEEELSSALSVSSSSEDLSETTSSIVTQSSDIEESTSSIVTQSSDVEESTSKSVTSNDDSSSVTSASTSGQNSSSDSTSSTITSSSLAEGSTTQPTTNQGESSSSTPIAPTSSSSGYTTPGQVSSDSSATTIGTGQLSSSSEFEESPSEQSLWGTISLETEDSTSIEESSESSNAEESTMDSITSMSFSTLDRSSSSIPSTTFSSNETPTASSTDSISSDTSPTQSQDSTARDENSTSGTTSYDGELSSESVSSEASLTTPFNSEVTSSTEEFNSTSSEEQESASDASSDATSSSIGEFSSASSEEQESPVTSTVGPASNLSTGSGHPSSGTTSDLTESASVSPSSDENSSSSDLSQLSFSAEQTSRGTGETDTFATDVTSISHTIATSSDSGDQSPTRQETIVDSVVVTSFFETQCPDCTSFTTSWKTTNDGLEETYTGIVGVTTDENGTLSSFTSTLVESDAKCPACSGQNTTWTTVTDNNQAASTLVTDTSSMFLETNSDCPNCAVITTTLVTLDGEGSNTTLTRTVTITETEELPASPIESIDSACPECASYTTTWMITGTGVTTTKSGLVVVSTNHEGSFVSTTSTFTNVSVLTSQVTDGHCRECSSQYEDMVSMDDEETVTKTVVIIETIVSKGQPITVEFPTSNLSSKEANEATSLEGAFSSNPTNHGFPQPVATHSSSFATIAVPSLAEGVAAIKSFSVALILPMLMLI